MLKSIAFAFAFLLLTGCKTFVVDTSPEAIASGDFTLINSCQIIPAGGLDICRVIEGSAIESSWVIMVPSAKEVLDGEIIIRYKDVSKSYSVSGGQEQVEIPFKDIVRAQAWSRDHFGDVLALGHLRFKDSNGTIRVVGAMGMAKIVVLKPGYSPLPLNSSFGIWEREFKCTTEYSTSGRSQVECK